MFKVGDTVRLKSGGPLMTVEAITDHGGVRVHCVWFEGVKAHRSNFPPATLESDDGMPVVA